LVLPQESGVSILQRRLAIEVVAFGFKHGVPDGLDLLFDVRFLRNPNYEPELEPLTGTDPAVGAYIAADPSTVPFLQRLFALIDFLIPRYADERSGLKIGIGCTGGRHRSVYIAHRLSKHLEAGDNVEVRLETRDAAR
jgi:RNase adapter protein RapZ